MLSRSLAALMLGAVVFVAHALAVEDPITISLSGVDIGELPDVVVLSSMDPVTDAARLASRSRSRALLSSERGRFQVSLVARNHIAYTFATPSLVHETFGVGSAQHGGVTVCGFTVAESGSVSAVVKGLGLRDKDLVQGEHFGRLFEVSGKVFVWVVSETEVLVCPMHPRLILGGNARCLVCEMPKVPQSQLPGPVE